MLLRKKGSQQKVVNNLGKGISRIDTAGCGKANLKEAENVSHPHQKRKRRKKAT